MGDGWGVGLLWVVCCQGGGGEGVGGFCGCC